ncbi:DUF2868 domain-containing protein [Nitrococcus mobilis]|uniref:DUF2868 domain-containing protein n=1 Tax=Nitrococcus mobilis Nb-231 TaxID=314278 RepID=A4BM82_9GAMM|nr:DUF2868 domain-containing protein [Nitrococcus mobilis]EAR23420.1 hypothetical protein NB231_16408 [Nitrococcus mobilis Nb-231]
MNSSNDADRPILADLVDLSVQVDRDAGLTPSELRRRDRPIGQKLAHLTGKPQGQLRQWLREISQNRPSQAGATAVKTLHRMALILSAVGLIIGWGAALAIFAYDGTRPVNVVNVLAAFVGVQLLLLLLTAIVALPRNLLQRLPGARPVQDLLGWLSPGRLVPVAARYLPAEHRLALEAALGRHKASHMAYGQVQKWLILRFSQILAIAFNIGALAGCLYLVTVSDLAFGWSTTLTVDSQSFHSLITQLAWPWRSWLPGAVPSIEVIDATRYFRFDHGILPNAPDGSTDVAALGQWWPFLLMAIACYGLLPRLGLFVLSQWRLDAALKTALVHAPGALQILDRMNRALVETAATEPEVRMKSGAIQEVPFPAHGLDRNRTNAYLINWAGINAEEEQFDNLFRRTMGVAVERMLYAGRMDSIDEDERTIDEVSSAAHNPPILVAVKSWEPPLLDFMDFLDALRTAVGSERLITVTPIMLDQKREFIPADPDDLDVWKKRLQSRGDSRIDFQPLSAEAA